MPGSAWLFVILFALVAALASAFLEIFKGNDAHPVAVALGTFVLAFLINWWIVYAGRPYFTWWSWGGYPLLFFIDMVLGCVCCLISAASNDTWTGFTAIGVITVALFVVWLLIAFVFTSPGSICDNDGYKAMANLLNIQNAKAAYPDVDHAEIIRVPETVALSEAGNLLSSGNQTLGSYLAPNRAYLQRIQGHKMWVVDLKVTDWFAFRTNGGVIPGYILVDAIDPKAPPQPKFGYQLRYVPGAWFGQNLDRRVYMDFAIGTPYQIQDLDGMEVDDNLNPFYVGTVVQQVIGYQGKKVVGVYVFDPQTGTGKFLTLNQKPTWVERIYPEDYFTSLITWWGNFHNHEACQAQGTSGQEMIDRVNAVSISTSGGIEYQVTMTSVGNDPSLKELITVDPTSGQLLLYSMPGKTLESIASKVSLASKSLDNVQYIAEGGQMLRVLNKDVAYYILTSATNPNGPSSSSSSSDNSGSSSGNTDYGVTGFAFVDVKGITSGDVNGYIAVGHTFDEAYAKFEQLEASTSTDAALASTKSDVQVSGIVIGNAQVASTGTQSWSLLISVQEPNGTVVYILAPGTSLNAAVAIVGKTITATCYAPSGGQTYLNVRHLIVSGVPDMDK